MKTLLARDPSRLPRFEAPVIVAIGNFDGLHRGHQALLSQMALLAGRTDSARRSGTLVLVSFHPHPAMVLGRAETIPLITSLRQKLELLGRAGVDCLYEMRFTKELAAKSAEQFLSSVLLDQLRANTLVAGPDITLGCNRVANAAFISDFLSSRGCRLIIVPFVGEPGAKIGSRRIRELIGRGELSGLSSLLGRPYILQARVVRGDGRGGKILGFPTANLGPTSQILPAIGVYAGFAQVDGKRYEAVIDVGVRPTFGRGPVTVETHLLDYNGLDLYGKRIQVAFLEKIRNELTFKDISALQRQIGSDVDHARLLLAKTNVKEAWLERYC
ncbi:MAG: riboflavin biosynthesis protein RibF [Deltaproteobacteria bacterium]|nr:riboflavin biosynthesis protein RibF [Deltaproteobacteria bacterium]